MGRCGIHAVGIPLFDFSRDVSCVGINDTFYQLGTAAILELQLWVLTSSCKFSVFTLLLLPRGTGMLMFSSLLLSRGTDILMFLVFFAS